MCIRIRRVKFLLQQPITTSDQQNWVAKLLSYNFEILYKPGQENRAVDALSRRAEGGQCLLLTSTPLWLQGAELLSEAQEDGKFSNFYENVWQILNAILGTRYVMLCFITSISFGYCMKVQVYSSFIA